MVGKRSNTLGLADSYTLNPLADPYKTQILAPLIQAARSRRWDVLYYAGNPNEEQAGAFPPFLDGRCDGLLCFTGCIDAQEVETILKTDLPVVFIGETQGEQAEHQGAIIDVDNEQGAYLGVSHLTSLGHTRIAMMQGVSISGNPNRIAGYRRALAERGLPSDDSLIYPTIAWEGSGYTQGIEILSRPAAERPTAVFCFNDVIAFGLLQAAVECGIRVPEDLSIVGFDDVLEAATTTPPLTTVRQPLAWIGQQAVEMLIEIIEGRLARDHRKTVPPELMIRYSTAPPPK
jgi:LacI family transcriptional regulator